MKMIVYPSIPEGLSSEADVVGEKQGGEAHVREP